MSRLAKVLDGSRTIDFGSFTLPLDFMSQTSAAVGIRGSGKTTTATVACEGLLEQGQQIVIIDPLDGWFGLKSSSDGTAPAYPVIVLGGRHGDLPLGPEDGSVLADFVVDEGASVILSLRHFESQADQRKLVTDFARRLFFRKGQVDKATPLLVVIDEASLFVPQRVGAQEAQMVGAIQKLVRQGRSSGIGVMLIDQRPASVNKDVLSQIELLIAHRVTNPHDQKALMAWVEQHDTEGRADRFRSTLAELSKGTAWFWSPGWINVFRQVHVRPRRTFDSSATPKIGETRHEPTVKAEIDLEALKSRLGATIERAREEDPKALRDKVRELEDKLSKWSVKLATPTPAIVETVEIERVPAKLYAELLATWQGMVPALRALEDNLSSMRHYVEQLEKRVDEARFQVETRKPSTEAKMKLNGLYGKGDNVAKKQAAQVSPRVRGERRVLFALAELGGEADKIDLAVRACYKHSAGGFANILSALASQKLVERLETGQIRLTPLGRQRADQIMRVDMPFESSMVLDEWKQKLDKPARLALEVLATVKEPLSTKEIALRIGYVHNAGGFANGISQLRANKLVEVVAHKKLRLSSVLVERDEDGESSARTTRAQGCTHREATAPRGST